eukprot:12993459-Alexandrium_andersonii.AAC.1
MALDCAPTTRVCDVQQLVRPGTPERPCDPAQRQEYSVTVALSVFRPSSSSCDTRTKWPGGMVTWRFGRARTPG